MTTYFLQIIKGGKLKKRGNKLRKELLWKCDKIIYWPIQKSFFGMIIMKTKDENYEIYKLNVTVK